ncbi:MAG: NAD(P)H-hydrate dehydratase [Bdellovibrionales bacterium]|nr:NAD(P)H-hydrate dehydratase [Bdellovibrionales bacterium]
MRVVTVGEMLELEQRSREEFGLTESLIIETVGIRVAEHLIAMLTQNASQIGERIIILIGKGNNGADGLAVARHLVHQGYAVDTFLLFPEDGYSLELKKQMKMAKAYGVSLDLLLDDAPLSAILDSSPQGVLLVDAVYGTGFRLPLPDNIAKIFASINSYQQGIYTISLDIPSGVTGDTGESDSDAVIANQTVAIGLPKVGHLPGSGPDYCGNIIVMDVSFPSALTTTGNRHLLSNSLLKSFVPTRNQTGSKREFGHLLVIGGSKGMSGAAVLTATAALKSGAGLVTVATWEDSYQELVSRLVPEAMLTAIPDFLSIDSCTEESNSERRDFFKRFDGVVIGPGLGRDKAARVVVLNTLKGFDGPVVVDADGIFALDWQKDSALLQKRSGDLVLTPHHGEFLRFANQQGRKILDSPATLLQERVAMPLNCSLVLKGPTTFLALADGSTYINHAPNDGMATAGSGDVLAGMIGSLLMQKPHHIDGVIFAVGWHSWAGIVAAESEEGIAMSAGTIISYLGRAFGEINSDREND